MINSDSFADQVMNAVCNTNRPIGKLESYLTSAKSAPKAVYSFHLLNPDPTLSMYIVRCACTLTISCYTAYSFLLGSLLRIKSDGVGFFSLLGICPISP